MIFAVLATFFLSLQALVAEEQRHCSSSSSSSSSSFVEPDCHWCHKHGKKGHTGYPGPAGKEGVVGLMGDVGEQGDQGETGPARIDEAFFALRSGELSFSTITNPGPVQFDNVVITTSNFTIYTPNNAVIISDVGTYRFTWSARTVTGGANWLRFNDTDLGMNGDVVPGSLYSNDFSVETINYLFSQAIISTLKPYTSVQLMFAAFEVGFATITQATFGIQRLA